MTKPLRKQLLRHSLEDSAKEYIGHLPGVDQLTFAEVGEALRVRFGKTLQARRNEFDAITQTPRKTIYEFADRVQRLAIGSGRDQEEVVNKFISGLSNQQLSIQL